MRSSKESRLHSVDELFVNRIMLRIILSFLVIPLFVACASSRPNSPIYDPPIYSLLGLNLDQKRGQAEYDAEKSSIESYAYSGNISWVEAAVRVRDLDKRFAARSDLDMKWKYDYNDDEYHAFSIAAAALVDKKQITFIEYDAARTRRFSEISARQAASRNSRSSVTCTTSVVFDRLVTKCR